MTKEKMSGSYLAIFVFAIVMCLLCLFTKATVGTVFWGYVTWDMYHRKIDRLATMFETVFWIDIVVGLATAIFAGDGFRYAGMLLTTGPILLIFGVLGAVMYGFRVYFRNLNTVNLNEAKGSEPEPVKTISSIVKSTELTPERILVKPMEATKQAQFAITPESSYDFWEIAYKELESGDKRIGIWAKCFAEANGDENATRAAYVKLRVEELNHEKTIQEQEERERLEKEEADRQLANRAALDAREEAELLEIHAKREQDKKDLGGSIWIPVVVAVLLFFVVVFSFLVGDKKDDRPPPATERIAFERLPRSKAPGETEQVAAEFRNGKIPLMNGTMFSLTNLAQMNSYAVAVGAKDLGMGVASKVEYTNNWWYSAERVFNIRIANTTRHTISALLLEYSDGGDCTKKSETRLFGLFPTNEIQPNSQYVVRAQLPFNNRGVACFDVVRAYGK